MTTATDLFKKASREAVVNAIREDAENITVATLSEIASREDGAFLADMPLRDILGELSKGATKAANNGGEVNTRTKEAREEFRKNVFDFMLKQGAEERVSAAQIRSELGGTGDQIRKALAVLIEEKMVSYEGKAQAMRYFVTKTGAKAKSKAA